MNNDTYTPREGYQLRRRRRNTPIGYKEQGRYINGTGERSEQGSIFPSRVAQVKSYEPPKKQVKTGHP